MEAFSFSLSTSHSHFSLHSTKHHPSSPPISFSLKPPPDSNNNNNNSASFRRPPKPLKIKTTPPPNPNPNPNPNSKPSPNSNPFKNPFRSSNSLTNKLWLTSKLSPPPPPPPPPCEVESEDEFLDEEVENEDGEGGDESSDVRTQFRQPGKIFVGNMPGWVKKQEVSEFFRQFGPIKNVILIRGHNNTERNAGYGFIIYDGETAENSAMKAVEFDGVEFHGRVLTVKLDDGKKWREKMLEREKWLRGNDDKEYKSTWHEERDSSRNEFQKVLETEPENWQAVVRAFERVKKVYHLNLLSESVA
ncbi:pentatricopeptide repeat-containing protein chloroplastic-like [Trifolium pratense]|uniref:Pentatricopeptide repeat-containing protein chloroplastic-like n=1 Tax=Trifolium pratense TaxID=57577 RepID=A0A2K3NNF0_TRIPR|nr:pentatricopeptide repeat-containing protein chloroplastic-like [Trifolium pratense]